MLRVILVMLVALGSKGCFEEATDDGTVNGGTNGGGTVADTSFTVESPDDVVWLGVYDRPTPANAPTGEVGSGFVAYTLSGLSGGQLKTARLPTRGPRLAWSKYRLSAAERILPTVLEDSATCPGGCSAGEYCLKQTCSSAHNLTLLPGEDTVVDGRFHQAFSTQLSGVEVVLVVDAQLTDEEIASVEQAVARFATELDQVASLLGLSAEGAVTDFNGDGRLLVVATSATVGPLQSDTIGWFNPADWGLEGDSNGADILWLRPGGDGAFDQQVGTLIHEYFHLAAFSKRAALGAQEPEALWLDEALAHSFEDLSGWGSSNLTTVEQGMLSFSEGSLSSGDDSLVQRGIGYTFIRHLIDRRARDAGASAADDSQVSESVTWLYSTLLNSTARGWNHPLLAGLSDSDIQDWLRSVLGARDGYLQPGTAATGQVVGFDPYGQFAAAEGFDVYLEGPQFEELFGTDGDYEGFVAESGWNVLQVTGLEPGTYTPSLEMTAGRSGVLVIAPAGGL